MKEQDIVEPHVAALERAIRIAGGNQTAFAKRISTFLGRASFKQQTVSKWLKYGTRLDAEWWPAIEHVTSQTITRRDLRPDIFGSDKAA